MFGKDKLTNRDKEIIRCATAIGTAEGISSPISDSEKDFFDRMVNHRKWKIYGYVNDVVNHEDNEWNRLGTEFAPEIRDCEKEFFNKAKTDLEAAIADCGHAVYYVPPNDDYHI